MNDLLLVFAFKFVEIFRDILTYAIWGYIIFSWIGLTRSPIGQILSRLIEPMLAPFRWAKIGMIDFSVIVLYLIISHGGFYLLKFLAKLIAA